MARDDNSRPRNQGPDLPLEQSDDKRESGLPGGGAGRRDEVGGSGVYPLSAGNAPKRAEIRNPAEWGQGERGAEGYNDSGVSEIFYYDAELEAAGIDPAELRERGNTDNESEPPANDQRPEDRETP
jgi:hypothetical protein